MAPTNTLSAYAAEFWAHVPALSAIEFFIPRHTVPKPRPRVGRPRLADGDDTVVTIMPTEYKRCKKDMVVIIMQELWKPEWVKDKWERSDSYVVTVDAAVERANAGDVDNLLGTFMDAASGILWNDDRQVIDGRLRKVLCPEGMKPQSVVKVERVIKPTGFELASKQVKTKLSAAEYVQSLKEFNRRQAHRRRTS